MNRYGGGDSETYLGRIDRSHKCGYSLRKIVNAHDQRRQQSRAHHSVPGRHGSVQILHALELMRILGRRDDPVDQGRQQHTSEKSERTDRHASAHAQYLLQRDLGTVQYFDERHVDHHPGRYAEREGKEFPVRMIREKRDRTADARSQTGPERQQERV